ncbi:MAG TPA: hypothetical protein VJU02_07310 [Nitrospiraceae bacterium]|nr:hypothetical protein [Nitrospiraceae bacterium]
MPESTPPSLGNLKPEVRELMRVSERLIGFAHQNHGSLSNDDCDAILYYIKDLQREILPFCSAHHQGVCSACFK